MLAHPVILWLMNTDLDAGGGYGTKMRPRNHHVHLAEPQQHVIDTTNPRRALDYRVEHRLDVRGRAADDAKHLSGSGLMLQRLAQFGIALLQLFEEPDILDGDHRLVGEGRDQRNLLISERPDRLSPDHDHSNGDTFPEQGSSKYGPEPTDFLSLGPLIIGVRQNIVNMN